MSKSELSVEENKSETVGVNRAGEGAFSPTPDEAAQKQIQKIEIDLSGIYGKLCPRARAAEILEDILRGYGGVEILVLVNFGDVFEILRDYRNIANRIFADEEDDNAAVEKIAQELAKHRGNIIVITFYDGYGTATAFIDKW